MSCSVSCSFLLLHTLISFFFFFNDTATTEIYTLSLHDALPILDRVERGRGVRLDGDEVVRPEGLEVQRRQETDDRRRGGLVAADLRPVGVRAGVRPVDHPRGEPQHFPLDPLEDRELGRHGRLILARAQARRYAWRTTSDAASSRALPCPTISPFWSTKPWWAISRVFRAFCSIRKTVVPPSLIARMIPKSCSTRRGANPRDGSSSSRSFGRPISARPIASIACSPPDIVAAFCRRRSASRGKSPYTYSRRAATSA